jgi:hypothetical protein
MTAAMRSRLPSLLVAQHAAPFLVFLLSTFLLGCAARRIAHDYVFGVTGIVTTEDGGPLQGADVTLEVNGSVYEGIDLVKSRHVETNDTAGFVFAYITGERGVKYTITVRKAGFEPETVSGVAPPQGNHTIRLKKGAEGAKGGY